MVVNEIKACGIQEKWLRGIRSAVQYAKLKESKTMTKKEREKILQALDLLFETGEGWEAGINILFKMVHGITWTKAKGFENMQSINVMKLKKRHENQNFEPKDQLYWMPLPEPPKGEE